MTWRLLRCLQVRSLRLEDERTDRTHAVEILQPMTEEKTPDAGNNLFARIYELAGRYARDGAEVTEAVLRADLGMPVVGGTAQGKRVLRVVAGMDIERYSRRNARQQSDLQHALNDLLNEAARAAGLDRQDWAKYPAGDGEIAVLPADADLVEVVSGFFGHLGSQLAAYNRKHPKDGFRLRAALPVKLM